MSMLKKLGELASAIGHGETALYVVMRALKAMSGGRVQLVRYHLVAQPIPEHPVPSCRPSARAAVRQVDGSDPVREAFPRPREVVQGRFDRDHVCLVATQDDVFVGFLWLAFDHYDEDEVRCRYDLLDPDACVWDYDVYLENAHRLGRGFSRLWDAANALLAEKGIRWSISRISAFNPASLAAHRRLGLKHLKSTTFLRFGPVQLSILPDRPYLHLGVSDSAVPRIRLGPPP